MKAENCPDQYRSPSLQILIHHIYEYNKGLRSMVLHTMCASEVEDATEFLMRKGIYFFVQRVTLKKVNVFFGDESCVRIIESFGNKSLSDYTDEQDFILGIMLGYDRLQQCERYVKRKKIARPIINKLACV